MNQKLIAEVAPINQKSPKFIKSMAGSSGLKIAWT